MIDGRRENPRSLAALITLGCTGLAAGALFVMDGCTAVDGLKAPQRDASVETLDAPSQLEVNDGCEHARVPVTPVGSPEDSLDGGTLDLLFALTPSVKFQKTVGFDLDSSCTCVDGGGETCRGSTATKHCDDPNGRDNAASILIETLGSAFPVQDRINTLVAAGKSGLLLRLQGYNGTDDDPTVQVSFYASRGTCTAADAGRGGSQADAAPLSPDCTIPAFDATDHWAYDPTQIIGEPGSPTAKAMLSKLASTSAYVAKGLLVARLDGLVPLAGLDLTLTGGVLTAQLARDPWRLTQGVVAGRWPLDKAFAALSRQTTGDGTPPICKNPAFAFLFSKEKICALADIMDVPSADNGTKICNAVSLGLSFEAAPASFGAPLPLAVAEECPDSGLGSCE